MILQSPIDPISSSYALISGIASGVLEGQTVGAFERGTSFYGELDIVNSFSTLTHTQHFRAPCVLGCGCVNHTDLAQEIKKNYPVRFPLSEKSADIFGDPRPFRTIYEEYRCLIPLLPEWADFLIEVQASLLDSVFVRGQRWCQKAKQILDEQFESEPYRVVTMERGARDIRFIMQRLGVDVSGVLANSEFFKDGLPHNWGLVEQYIKELGLHPTTLLENNSPVVFIDTGFVGSVIYSLIEVLLLLTPQSQDNSAFADHIEQSVEPGTHLVFVGGRGYGLREMLKMKGFSTSEFFRAPSMMHVLQRDNSEIDDFIRVEKAYYGKEDPVIALSEHEKVAFVVLPVQSGCKEEVVLRDYLTYRGIHTPVIIKRQLNNEQKKLLSLLHGFMVTANSDSYYPELVPKDLQLRVRAEDFEGTFRSHSAVSRQELVLKDNKVSLALRYFDPLLQLKSLYYLWLLCHG